ncbi:hypothetical protein D3C72_761590 [compost metagenome]
MQITAKFGLALDVGKFAIAKMHHTADARWFAKAAWVARIFQHRQAVDLADDFPLGFNQDLAQLNFILHPLCEVAFTPFAGIQCGFECFGGDALFLGIQRRFRKLLADPQRGERQIALIAAVTHGLNH